MKIELATKQDLKYLNKIISKEFAYTNFTQEKLLERIQRPEIVIFKKTSGKRIIAFIELELLEEFARINGISVEHEYRKQGHGKELLEFAVNFLKNSGVPTARLLVKEENQIAKNLYSSLGFEFISIHDKEIEGSKVEVWEKHIIGSESYLN